MKEDDLTPLEDMDIEDEVEPEVEMEPMTFDEEQLREDLKLFYSEYFDRTLLDLIFVSKPFGTREFAVLRMDFNSWVRNRSFENIEVLLEYLTLYPAKGVYIGALYDEPLTREKSIHNTKWVGRELLFDLDMDAYDPVRTCDCTGRKVCEICWVHMQEAALIIDDTLRIDFGFEKLVWVYTGGRGYHCWVLDDSTFALTRDQRVAIVSYMQLIIGDEIKELGPNEKFMKSRIINHLAKNFIRDASETILKEEAGFGPTTVKSAKAKINSASNQREILELIPNTDDFFKAVIRHRYPRIDQGVTVDLKKVIRMPGSVHLGTKNVSEIIDNPWDFNPIHDAKSLYDVIGRK